MVDRCFQSGKSLRHCEACQRTGWDRMFVVGKPKQSKTLYKNLARLFQKMLINDIQYKSATQQKPNRITIVEYKTKCLLSLRGIIKKIIRLYKINC